MRAAGRAPLIAALVVVLPVLAGCSGAADESGTGPLSDHDARRALLTIEDVGPAYGKAPLNDDDTGAGSAEGADCLSRATRDLDSVVAATEVRDRFHKSVGVAAIAATERPADARPDEAVQLSVLSKVSSFADPGRAERILDDLANALQGCDEASYGRGPGKVTLNVSVTDARTDDALDQQVSVLLDGSIEAGDAEAPFTVHLQYFRSGNDVGALNVSILGPAGAGMPGDRAKRLAEQRATGTADEVQRLLDIGVERFLDVTAG